MLLGKKYTRIKRAYNATVFKVTFTRKEDGTAIELPRKLNMLAVLSLGERVNQKAVEREIRKFEKRLKEESEREINKEVEEMINEYQNEHRTTD